MRLIVLILSVLLVGLGCSNQHNKSNEKVVNSKAGQPDIWYPNYTTKHYPITSQYYDEFYVAKTATFSGISIQYWVNDYPEISNARDIQLEIYKQDVDNQNNKYFIRTLANIDNYNTYYDDQYTGEHMLTDIPASYVDQILDIINDNRNYYLNAAEYEGNSYLDFFSVTEWKFKSYFCLMIDDPIDYLDEADSKAIIKYWDRNGQPPVELQPMIQYIEGTVIPYLRTH